MRHLTSDVIGPELLSVVKRNGFFELDPKEAIRGAFEFFNDIFFCSSAGLMDQI